MKDNILLITTDQQRFDTIQKLGNKHIFTPHLNYMASEGIAFTRCYADCPICMPSRTTIMTGYTGYQSKIVGNANHQELMERETKARRTLPAILTENGYQTKAMGKMHFEPARANYGFEDMELPLDYMRYYDNKKQDYSPKKHGVGECECEPVISTVPASESITAWTVEQSVDFIETRDPLRPFFMWTSFTKPHPPFDPCMEFWTLYENKNMPLPIYGDWSEDLERTPQGFLAGTYENSNMHLHSEEQLRAVKRAYYSMITQVDYSLGRLFGCLREQDLFKNTWIVFTADHGEMLGDHHAAQKNLYFEGSAHIPLIIVPPKRIDCKRNIEVDYLAQMADIYPTILKMAGIEPPEDGRTGVDLMSLDEEREFYGTSINTHFCLMKDGIKLVYCRCGGHYLMFDMKKDKMDQHDISNNPDYKEIFEKMKKELVSKAMKYSPELFEKGEFIVTEPPKFPGDSKGHWYGFHYKDYTVDTFH